eukprot:TRINITY_DN951_c0_g1_i1.p1 TRINITY_DN951_c0_g1~~TRINITY_DN951_c0_g1_i1.p1  ORF type:complete len:334 (+),score=66.75 TRINITY_DN951_c0_g1_i1:1108-2109(+)
MAARQIVNLIVNWNWLTASNKADWIVGKPPSWRYLAMDKLMRSGKGKTKHTLRGQRTLMVDFKNNILVQKPGTACTLGGVPCHKYGNGTGKGVVLYFHGGCYVSGEADCVSAICTTLANQINGTTYSVDYRLAPEHPLPAATADVISVYKDLIENQSVDPSNITCGGESAGGGLALLFLQELHRQGLPQPAAAFTISGWFDISCSTDSYDTLNERDPMLIKQSIKDNGEAAAGNRNLDFEKIASNDLKDPLMSGLFAPMTGLCPIFFLVGGAELMKDETIQAHQKATDAGVTTKLMMRENMMHVWPIFVDWFPEANEAVSDIATFLKEHIKEE